MRTRWFITGGTGLVGSHVAALLTEQGQRVRVLIRATSETTFLRGLGAELVVGDVTGPADPLARAIDGCDVVVHAAAILYPRGASWERYRRVNVDATDAVLEAAARAGARRVVHVSSIAVYGGRPGEAAFDEDGWLEGGIPERAYYPRSKRAAELRAWAHHEAGAIRLTTVRPGVVYGERDRLFTRQLMRAARLPLLPLPGGGRAMPPVVYAGNVAHGIVEAATRDVAIGRSYNLPADDGASLRDLLETLGSALGRRPRVADVPGAPFVWV
ncbi:MAG: NAD-dependent epimerase/dehydratase family protein, partial [Longimicrobiales bacterium]